MNLSRIILRKTFLSCKLFVAGDKSFRSPLTNLQNMPLFRCGGEPLKFRLVDIDGEEFDDLKKLIEDAGGEVTDDDEGFVMFTSPEASRTKSYVRAKIYDVAFIVDSVEEQRFVEPEKYRLGHKVPEDEFLMLHFLYGDCRRICNNSGRFVIGTNSDFFATAQSSIPDEARSQSSEMNTATLNPPSNDTQPHRVEPLFIDESMPVVDELELAMIYRSSLASGDVAENIDANEEKRPCNLEYERDIEPKMVALADEARRLAESREKLSVQKSPRPRRSPRTVARKNVVENVVTVKQEVPSDAEETENLSRLSKNENDCSFDGSMIQAIDIERETPEPPVVIQIDDPPTDPETSKKTTQWISTKKNHSKKVANDGIKSIVVQPANESESPKVHKATKRGEKLSEKPNLPESAETKQTKKISEDGNVASKKTHSEETSESESDTEARPVANNSKKRKATVRRLPPLRKTIFDRIYASSNSSSDDEPSNSKRSRKRVPLSDSSDEVVISDSDSDNKSPSHGRKKSAEAGPSGVRRELQNNTDDKSSGTNTHRHQQEPQNKIHVNERQMKKSQPHGRNGSDEAGPSGVRNEAQIDTDGDESSDEYKYEEHKPKIEMMHVDKKVSRGKVWRDKLLNGSKPNHLSRKPFTPPERLKMLRYLIKNKVIHQAKGLVIWTNMINDGYLTHRTPQSLHNHFIKYILPNIRSLDCILSTDMKKFLALKGEK